MPQRALLPILLALLASGCGSQDHWNVGGGSTTPRYQRVEEDPTLLGNTVLPVRVGEQGPSFAACNSEGAIRSPAGAGPVPVRAAPYDQARRTGQLAPSASFFICTRSMDQRWLGIVYERGGVAASGCRVSAPISSGGDYEGPCESGWISSAQVRLISGVDEPPLQATGNTAR